MNKIHPTIDQILDGVISTYRASSNLMPMNFGKDERLQKFKDIDITDGGCDECPHHCEEKDPNNTGDSPSDWSCEGSINECPRMEGFSSKQDLADCSRSAMKAEDIKKHGQNSEYIDVTDPQEPWFDQLDKDMESDSPPF